MLYWIVPNRLKPLGHKYQITNQMCVCVCVCVVRSFHTKLQTAPSTRVLPPSARVRVKVRVRVRVTGFVLSLWILSVILQAGLMHDDAVYAEKPAVMVCFVIWSNAFK